MLPQGNMKNVDFIFRKAIPNSRYLGLCGCGWGTTVTKTGHRHSSAEDRKVQRHKLAGSG